MASELWPAWNKFFAWLVLRMFLKFHTVFFMNCGCHEQRSKRQSRSIVDYNLFVKYVSIMISPQQ